MLFFRRFLAIWWPLKLQITKRRARLMILCIWIIAIVSTIPWALFFDLVEAFEDVPDIKICVEVWPPGTNGTLYFILANLVACYILPMLLISLCYILIWIKVWRRSIPGDTRDAHLQMQQKSKVKVVKMLVAVVILFVLSWLPLYVIFARIKFGGPMNSEEEEIFQIATPIAQWLGSSNSCINPVLYAFFNKKYRRGFAAIIKSRTCCGRLRYYESVAIASSSTSTRKSSHYHNNQQQHQNSTRKSQYSPTIKTDAVSYIYESTNGTTGTATAVNGNSNSSNGNANFKKVIAKQDSSLSRQMLLKQQDSLLSRQSDTSSSGGSISYIESRRRGFMCKQKSSLSSQESVVSFVEPKSRYQLVKQDSVISFADPPTTPPRRHVLVKQDSVISFADQPQHRRGILTKQDSVFTYPSSKGGSDGPFPYHVSILKKSDSQCSSPIRKTIEFIE